MAEFNLLKHEAEERAAAAARAAETPLPTKKHGNYKGTEHIPMTVFSGWEDRATRDEIEFAMTIEDVERIWVEQNGKCAVTGRPLTLTTNDPCRVSLDRVDSNAGYRLENVRLVCTSVNYARHTMTDDDLRKLLQDMQWIDTLRERLKGKPVGGNWWTAELHKDWE